VLHLLEEIFWQEDFALTIRSLIKPENLISLKLFLSLFHSLLLLPQLSLMFPSYSLSLSLWNTAFQPCKISLILPCRLTNQISFTQQTVISLFAGCLSADGRLFRKSDGERKDGRVKANRTSQTIRFTASVTTFFHLSPFGSFMCSERHRFQACDSLCRLSAWASDQMDVSLKKASKNAQR